MRSAKYLLALLDHGLGVARSSQKEVEVDDREVHGDMWGRKEQRSYLGRLPEPYAKRKRTCGIGTQPRSGGTAMDDLFGQVTIVLASDHHLASHTTPTQRPSQ